MDFHGAHPRHYFFLLEDGFSLCERALPEMLLVLALDRPSRRAAEALLATLADVTFLAMPILSRPLAGVLL